MEIMDDDLNDLNTVESYDVFGDKWLPMPNMMNNHYDHSLVVVKNKLFVIDCGRNNCEIYDNVFKKFVSFKHSTFITFNRNVCQ